MTDPCPDRVAALFHAALEHGNGEAAREFLREACKDKAVLAEVETLLAAHERNDDFLEHSPSQLAAELIDQRLANRLVDRNFGPWRVDRLLHSGGMGSVYLAHRENDDFVQRGALKLIRAGLSEAGMRERFSRERRLLASLEHPGIARLLDGGTTDDGVPWLVMEYVDGIPIDRWADEHELDVDQRLALFERLCAAVEHAHRHLVIHRDIKPGNVLVTADGTPRLLDFGIARLLAPANVDTEVTSTRHRMLTPACASPEQILGLEVTTASDVYQLGVLLYRVLTGHLPLDITSETSAARTEQMICEQTPQLPSTQVARGTARRLRGDLDAIVMTALRKEPERRYGSVAAMVEDLRRFRRGEPVQARPDTLRYRAGKFFSRHWRGLAAAASVFLALSIALTAAVWQAESAREERDRLQLVNQFLQGILLEADPTHSGTDATVRDMLATASERIGNSFGNAPEVEASIRHTIGYAQLSLMLLDEAETNLGRASVLNQQLYGATDPRSLRSRAYLAWLEHSRGRHDQAAADYADLIDQLASHHPQDLRATIHNDYGLVLSSLGRNEQALAQFSQALELHLQYSPEHPDLPIIHNNIGYAWHEMGDLNLAESHYRQALEHLRRQHAGQPHPDVAYGLNNLGVLLRDLDRRDQALPLYRESLSMRAATLGEHHPATGRAQLNLARLLLEMGRHQDARPHAEHAWEIARSQLEPDQSQYLIARATRAWLQFLEGKSAQAVSELTDSHRAMVEADLPQDFIDQVEGWLEAAENATADSD